MTAKPESHADLIDDVRREMQHCQPLSRDAAVFGWPRIDDSPTLIVAALSAALPGYDVAGALGRGGQGLVLRGVQRATRRDVAIKVLRSGPLDSDVNRGRFDREVQILGQLKHPNIVTILDSGAAGGHEFFIMDYIRGHALTEFVRETAPDVPTILRLFAKLCDALGAAHLRGIVHRDLKPANIRVDPSGEPHVLDFGLAKVNPDDVLFGPSALQTQTGYFIGSVAYAAPEQFRGNSEAVDVRTDVYAMGVLLYEALTGSLPYAVDGPLHATIDRIVRDEPPPASRLNARIGADVDAIVRKCLSKEPEQRYQNAGELTRELQRYLKGEPIEARRDSSWYVLRKAIRRHRVPAAMAALGLALLVTFAGGMTLLYQKEAQRSAAARREAAQAQEQARVLDAVLNFVNDDLLASVKVDSRGRAETLLGAVENAAERLDEKYANDPKAEGAIRALVGEAYLELSDYRQARIHAERSLDLRRARFGPEAAETLAAMNLCGRLYRRLNLLKEADAIFAEMVPAARRTLGDDHPLTLQGCNNYAYVLSTLGKRQEAYDLNQIVLDARMRILGPENVETLSSLNNKSYYLESLGDREQAERICRQVYEARARLLGYEHADTLRSMTNLASFWHRLGRLDEARDLLDDCTERIRAYHGEHHEEAVNALTLQSQICRRVDCYPEAEAAVRAALEIQIGLTGENHRLVAGLLRDYGELCAEQRRFGEADELLQRGWETFRDSIGEQHATTWSVRTSIGNLRRLQGLYREAEAITLEAHRGIAAALGDGHPELRKPATLLVRLYEDEGDQLRAAEWQSKLESNNSTDR